MYSPYGQWAPSMNGQKLPIFDNVNCRVHCMRHSVRWFSCSPSSEWSRYIRMYIIRPLDRPNALDALVPLRMRCRSRCCWCPARVWSSHCCRVINCRVHIGFSDYTICSSRSRKAEGRQTGRQVGSMVAIAGKLLQHLQASKLSLSRSVTSSRVCDPL